ALITPLISDSKKVLGEETYLAQGRGNSGNTGQARPNPAQDKVNEQIQNLPQEVSPEKIEKLRNLPPIQAESKGGNGRVDITRGGVITEIEKKSSDSGITIRADRGDGNKVELTPETLEDIKARLNATDLQVATDGGGLIVGKRHI